MNRVLEEIFGIGILDNLAGIHNGDFIAHVGY
jgi:hypothetical protein